MPTSFIEWQENTEYNIYFKYQFSIIRLVTDIFNSHKMNLYEN